MTQVISPLREGDLFPDFKLRDQTSRLSVLSLHARGKPIVLLLVADPKHPKTAKLLNDIAKHWNEVDAAAHFFAITAADVASNAQAATIANWPFLVLSDPDGLILRGFGQQWQRSKDAFSPSNTTVVVCNANRRIATVATGSFEDPVDFIVGQTRDVATEGELLVQRSMPPVIYVPRVLDPDLCQQLIELHRAENVASGVLRDRSASHSEPADSEVKSRRDHFLEDRKLIGTLKIRFERRMLPEINKATFYHVAGFEKFKIGRYDAETGGVFKPHRDNDTMAGAHRRFAVTLNLNTGEYDGGELRFPEYSRDRFSPATGDAVVFSCSLLHEVLPITRGQRYVLLAFLFGADAQPAGGQRPQPPR
ncbi:2OG-Fe(II) oxygenase [Algihabitans albus]|uniref:2OG-Fe(II) oxygenase n=1 Tax=Algihabitans albus TaxID=2164067 RepID=UPI000E5CF9D5|nr:2OG-Fe(II) oxygenase [Algihabitans albus]